MVIIASLLGMLAGFHVAMLWFISKKPQGTVYISNDAEKSMYLELSTDVDMVMEKPRIYLDVKII